nr:hypothetical protein [Tanacetum cinerariifolium]
MDHQYPTVAKIHVLDTGKFEQWQFRVQQYLQHEHYALWESGRTVTFTIEDMQKKKNDVKARNTLLLSLPDEHQLRNDLDSMSYDLYNHLKVYEAEVQKKSNSNSQDMAFISSSKNSSNEDGNIVCVTTSSTAFPTGSVNVATISQDTASAYIASQSNGSQIKFEDINQIDEDDMEEMDIKWNMALLSMRADKFWKRTRKKISIQGSDVAGFDKSKVECFNCHKMGHFAKECRAPKSQEIGRKESFRQGSKAKEKSSKALMAIDGVGWEWSYMANKEDHALIADGEAPTEFALMANIENKVKEGVGYNAVPLPAADLYLSPKKDLSWTGLPEFVDDTITDYSRPSPTIVSTSRKGQNKDSSTAEDVASPNSPKPFVKFVKPKDIQPESKSKEQETPKKSQVKYAKQYRHSNKRPKGNQRNWNNLKSYQLGLEFVFVTPPNWPAAEY